jgi:hypothetical protein
MSISQSSQPIVIPQQNYDNNLITTNSRAGLANLTPANIANNAIDQSLFTLSNTYYPVVGKTYMITLGYTFDVAFAAVPAGVYNLGLGYWNGSAYTTSSKNSTYAGTSSTLSDLYGSITFIFTHTASTNVVRIIATNLTGQQITGASSALQITAFSVTELSPSAGTVTGAPFS